jgi:hypothetical protein
MVFRETTSPQLFKVATNGNVANKIVFIDEEANTSETMENVSFTSGVYYLQTSIVLPIKEGKDYRVLVYNNNNVVYTGKIYCTNQSVDSYTINKNEYVQRSTENEFIVYE